MTAKRGAPRAPQRCSVCRELGHKAPACPLVLDEVLAYEKAARTVASEIRTRGLTREQWDAAPSVPLQRADCEAGARPCPFLRCRHHLGVARAESCSLDVADDGGVKVVVVGALLGVTRERARQLEASAVGKLRRHGVALVGEPA